tara:strand:+ start:224 stop:643 length:420 start_codon:yes stop_codon:yes gene_type:complete
LIKKITDKDKKDWIDFLKSNEKLISKDVFNLEEKKILREKFIDLHGYTLDQANKRIHNFIIKCYKNGVDKLTVITGKGLRSKNINNPYQSSSLSILKYSVPEYINSKSELLKIIKSINVEDIKSISKGSFVINLKKFKE